MATSILFLLIVSLLSISSSSRASPTTISNAAHILSDSGYLSMALTLQLTSASLNLKSPVLTVFAVSDLAFTRSGQMSLSDLLYHISPVRVPKETLETMLYGSKIPTFQSNRSLIVTPGSSGKLSINGVRVREPTIFDDGYLVIYGIDEFFKSWFHAPEPSPNSTTDRYRGDLLSHASNLLISRGYTIMATFLDSQLWKLTNQSRLTVFAPVDEAITRSVKGFSNYSTIFKGHVVEELVRWKDLQELNNGYTMATGYEGSLITLTWSGDILLLNDVPVIFPDMYVSDWVAVHGLNRLIAYNSVKEELTGEAFGELQDGDYDHVLDYGEAP